jgi:thymidine kinase
MSSLKPDTPAQPSQAEQSQLLDVLRQLLHFVIRAKQGWFCYFYGPMFAEKTSTIISICRHFELAGQSVLAVKFSEDDRESKQNELCTHDGDKFPAFRAKTFESVQKHIKTLKTPPQIIAFDEGQFFLDSPQWILQWTQQGICVVGAGLLSDCHRHIWPIGLELLEIANTRIAMTSMCESCHQPATLTALRTMTSSSSSSSSSTSAPIVAIGGKERYVAMCIACHPDRPVVKT